jgi:prevent-host-death family protein
MSTIGMFDAKTHFSQLIERVLKGERITITRHGVPVAVISPPVAREQLDVKRAVEELKAFRKGRTLGGIKIRDLINEGRR